jgi:two-component system alkaline phosphatase synthesis response regulator PhoP
VTAILVADGEPGRAPVLCDRLVREGYDVDVAATGETALSGALSGVFDGVLLDAHLPGRSGLDVCRELRRSGFDGAVVLLTDRHEAVERVLGLKLGADDVLTRPYEPAELVARVAACLRRGAGRPSLPAPVVLRFGPLEVHLREARVLRHGRDVPLSPREFDLLRCFVENAGTVLSRDELLDRVWGADAMPSPRTVDVHVAWLRRKLEDDPGRPTLIRTVHRVGYRFAGKDGATGPSRPAADEVGGERPES